MKGTQVYKSHINPFIIIARHQTTGEERPVLSSDLKFNPAGIRTGFSEKNHAI